MVHSPPPPDLWTTAEAVDNASTDAVNRVRRRSVRWWRDASARDGWTRADVVAGLVATYAVIGQAVEGAATRRVPERPPREAVLADQLAVVAYDLVLALRAATPGAAVTLDSEVVPVEVAAERAIAETRATVRDVDPR